MWRDIFNASVIFITTWATVFPVAIAMFQGFRGVSETLRAVGRNFGLRGLSHTARILIPGALPSIMTGLRNGLSNAWIRASHRGGLVIGAALGTGGLGLFVMAEKQNSRSERLLLASCRIMLVG